MKNIKLITMAFQNVTDPKKRGENLCVWEIVWRQREENGKWCNVRVVREY